MIINEEVLKQLEDVLAETETVKALGAAKTEAAVQEILCGKGIEVDSEFAQAMLAKRNEVLASDELNENALDQVAGGKGFAGMFAGAAVGVGIGGIAGGPCGAVFGGLVGAIIGGLA